MSENDPKSKHSGHYQTLLKKVEEFSKERGGNISISLVQRKFKLTHASAQRILDDLCVHLLLREIPLTKP